MALDLQPSSELRSASPALRGFELNPFRALRLDGALSASDAVLSAESVLTLKRVDLAPDEPDALPWRPEPTLYDLQQAAQAIEEPLVRLKQQLLWFDFSRDPYGELLRQALQNPGSMALDDYLGVVGVFPSEHGDLSAAAHAINQANLRLVLSAAQLSGSLDAGAARSNGAIRLTPGQWEALKGFRILKDAHLRLAQNGAGGAGLDAKLDAKSLWADALQRWSNLFKGDLLRGYVAACIQALDDDFVTDSDAETICESLKIHLIDLSVQEIRFLLLEGRHADVKAFASALSGAGFDAALVTPAMRPLRQIFQLELAELEGMLDQSSTEDAAAIVSYLEHVKLIRNRWEGLDSQNTIGLLDMMDQSVEKVYLRLRNMSNDHGKVEPLLALTKAVASAQSLRERIATYEKELEVAKTRLCHFCKTGQPDYDKSVVLRGKKETHRERHFNSTTIYYSLRYGIVLRCAKCAEAHSYITRSSRIIVAGLVPGLLVLAMWLSTQRW